MRSSIIIIAVPASPGRFIATVAGKEITDPTCEPFFDGCRALLAGGADRSTAVVMRHVGSTTDCLRSTVGNAARLTVRDDDSGPPRLVRWKTLNPRDVFSPVAQNDLAATGVQGRSKKRILEGDGVGA